MLNNQFAAYIPELNDVFRWPHECPATLA